MRSVGCGHAAAKRFCALMNMPPPSRPIPYSRVQRTIYKFMAENHKLIYGEYFGDGDSKSFQTVRDVYLEDHGITVEKKGCVGHVQKRLGTALRKLKKETKGMGGKGRLTDAMIDKLQNYYGIAIRGNPGDLAGMKKAITPGQYCQAESQRTDNLRVSKANYKERATTKKRRKLIRGRKKKKGDNAKEKEGVTYATGSGSFL